MPLLLGINALIAIAVFAFAWALCVRVRNYGFLDVTWTLCIGLLAVVDCVYGSGNVARRTVFAAIGAAWSLRLGLFVLRRVLRHHPVEDKRYRSLRERWTTPRAFLGFFELQALIAVVFSLPFLAAAFAPATRMARVEWVGLTIALIGVVGEAVADHQSETFKRRADAKPKILDVGLWRYSRHPNYFFEIVSWTGFATAAIVLPAGWLGIACPLLIGYFLLCVTGIPLTEKHSLETHGDAYRAYQRRTSSLIPWPWPPRVHS